MLEKIGGKRCDSGCGLAATIEETMRIAAEYRIRQFVFMNGSRFYLDSRVEHSVLELEVATPTAVSAECRDSALHSVNAHIIMLPTGKQWCTLCEGPAAQ